MKKSTSPRIKKIVTKKTSPRSVKKVTSKKMVIKKIAKKVPSPKKNTPPKQIHVLPLVNAPESQKFWVNDGQILSDLVSLAESLKTMDSLLFHYHVNSEKNDFADWVEHVLQDISCAQSLRNVLTPEDAYVVVSQRLRFYTS
jgi:hypothetical protein